MEINFLNNFYMAVPKDTILNEISFEIKNVEFIFADKKSLDIFLDINSEYESKVKCSLINESLNVDKPFVINDKYVYVEHVIPKIHKLGASKIYLYDNDLLLNRTFEIIRFTNYEEYQSFKLKTKYNTFKVKYNESKEIIQECPICRCKQFTRQYKDIVRLHNTKVYVVSDDYYVMCDKCGIVTKESIYSNEYYNEYLNLFYDVNPTSITPQSLEKANYRTEVMSKLKKTKFDNILEVSSFDGATLDTLQKYFNANVVGVEPTISAVELCEDKYPKLKGKIIKDVFEHFCQYKQSEIIYDLVLFSNAFRHFHEPKKVLEIVNKITKDGSLLIIDEGNFLEQIFMFKNPMRIQREFFQQKAFYYMTHHIIYLLQQYGFGFVEFNKTDHNGTELTLLVFQKGCKSNSQEVLLDISKRCSENAIQLMKQFYYSDDTIIDALKVMG